MGREQPQLLPRERISISESRLLSIQSWHLGFLILWYVDRPILAYSVYSLLTEMN